MAAMPEFINVQLDPVALRKQVEDALLGVTRSLAWSLRNAADDLDPEYSRFRAEELKNEYERGLADGRTE